MAEPQSQTVPVIQNQQSAQWRSWRELAFCSTEAAREVVPFASAEKLDVLPLGLHATSRGEQLLTVVVSRPITEDTRSFLRFLSNARLQELYAPASMLAQARFAAYFAAPGALVAPSSSGEQSAPTLLHELIKQALAHAASDIHIETQGESVRIRIRTDGMLREMKGPPIENSLIQSVIRHIRVLANMDGDDPWKPQEGGFSYVYTAKPVRIRVSILAQGVGVRVVLRLLGTVPRIVSLDVARKGNFQALGMSVLQEQVLQSVLGVNSGSIVLAGPTGSGKSTLLYEAISFLESEERSIISIEDPIERLIEGVSQTEVDRRHGLDYQDYLKPLLRQDPDVIMIGEIRDAQTAITALQAGITGHLVLTTIHARSVFDVLVRLSELSVSKEVLALSLRQIVAQRLIPKNCEHCFTVTPISPRCREYFNLDTDTSVGESCGCGYCMKSGIDGRVGVFETLTFNEMLKEYLLSESQLSYGTLSKRLPQLGLSSLCIPLAKAVRERLLAREISPFFALQALDISPKLFGINRQLQSKLNAPES